MSNQSSATILQRTRESQSFCGEGDLEKTRASREGGGHLAAATRASTSSKSNDNLFEDIYQSNRLVEDSTGERYRKSTTEVYDSFKFKSEQTSVYDQINTSQLLEQGFATVRIDNEQNM